MPRASCPTPDELRAFHLGDLPEAALEEVAAHLEGCPACEAAASALDAVSDPLVAAYRDSALAAPLAAPAAAPRCVGDYEILVELGRGGMGVVYKARHRKLPRTVALKMLLGGSFVTSEERARFRTEAEAVARLRHPSIVQIYEVGEHEVDAGLSRPYFTLEFAGGGNLAGRLAGRPQPPRQAAAWLEVLARAAHYAHQQGIVHRDLKPSNVLLTEAGEPMLCDFGVAKLMTGSDVKTRSGTLLGTAEYMAPEQACEGERVGPAADVYALGAILYTMLSGRPPFQGSSTLHILEQVRSQEPVPLRRLLPHLPRDLETICHKCLEKDPAHRYASAEELADDLRRFLADEPIRARPAPAWERGWKWAKRRPAVAGLLAAVVLLTLLGLALFVGLWRGAEARVQLERTAKHIARDAEREQARGRHENLQLLADVTLDHGLDLCTRGEVNHGLLLLARALERAEQAGVPDLSRVARLNLAVWRRRLVTLRAKLRHDGWAWAVAFSPDGQTALTGGKDNCARRWDVRTGQPLGEPLRHRYPVWAVAFSPDGCTLLTAGGDDAVPAGEARLWDAATGEPLGPPLPLPDEVHAASFSADGRRFLTACDGEVRVWQVGKGRPDSLVLPHPAPPKRIERLQPRLWAVFRPNSEEVLTGGEDGTARLWDAATGAPRGEPLRHDGPVLALAFSRDGRTIATGSYDGTARLWDAATGRPKGPPLPHLGRVHTVTLRSDDQFLATASSVEDRDPLTGRRTTVGGQVRLWRPETGEVFGDPIHLAQPVWAVAFRPGGGKLLAGCRDRAARFYSIFDGSLLGKPLDHEGNVANVVFSPNGRLALTASAGGDDQAHARLWELAPGDPVVWSVIADGAASRQVRVTDFSADGKRMIGLRNERVGEYDAKTGQPAGPPIRLTHGARDARYAPDGRYLVTVGERYDVRFWDREAGREVGAVPPGAPILHLGPAGEYVAAARTDHTLAVYRVPTGERLGPVLPLSPQDTGLLLTSDGRTLYTYDRTTVKEWDVRTGSLVRTRGAPGAVLWVRLAAGRPVVLTGRGGHLARVYDLETGRPVSGPLGDLAGSIQTLAFSPDGRYLLAGVWDLRQSRLWDLATGKPVGPPVQHGDGVSAVGFTADGARMMSGSVNGEFRSQEVPRPVPGDAGRVRCWVEVLTGMTLDDEGTVADLAPEAVQERRDLLRRLGGPPDGIVSP